MACILSELQKKVFNTTVVKIVFAHYKICMYLIASSNSKFESRPCHHLTNVGRCAYYLKSTINIDNWRHTTNRLTAGYKSLIYIREPRMFCQRGSNSDSGFFFFQVEDEGRRERIQIKVKAGHHQSTSKTPFKWRFAGGLIMNQH